MLFVLLTCTLLAAGSAPFAQSQDPTADPSSELARVVDLATSTDRKKAALELAKRADVTLDQWKEAAATFGSFQAHEPGEFSQTISLMVEGKLEQTTIHYWVPSAYRPGNPTAVLVALHGAGGMGAQEIQIWKRIASELGMLILAPTEAGANIGYGFSSREQQSVLQALRWFRRKFNVDENRVHLSGVSRGGHLCWELALRYPGVWASVSPRIGGPSLSIVGGRNTIRLATNLAHIPLRLLQGLKDDPKMIINQRLLFDRLNLAHATDAEFVEFEDLGHNYEMGAVSWMDFFGKAMRDPQTSQFVFRTARLSEAGMYWVRMDKLDKSVKDEFQPKVNPNDWNRWDHEEKARFIQAEADGRTAEIMARFHEPGNIELASKGVKKIVLFLTTEMLNSKGRIEIQFKGKLNKKRPKASKKVLLQHFAEHFDRQFLPAYEIKLNG